MTRAAPHPQHIAHAQRISAAGRDEADRLMAELDALEAEIGIENKSLAAPSNKALRGPPPRGDDMGVLKHAVATIGKHVLRQGEDIKAVLGKRQRAWSAFQETNDARLNEFRRHGRVDPLTDHKLGRINRALDLYRDLDRRASRMEAKHNRPPGMGARYGGRGGAAPLAGAKAMHRAAVVQWLKTGQETFHGQHLTELERAAYPLSRKGLFGESGPAGGYLLVPERDSSPLATFLNELSPMRQRATVRPTMRDEFVRPLRTGNADAGWVAEREDRPETAAPTLGEQRFPGFELYANPAITMRLLDNADLDVEAWLTEEISEAFALQESDAWFNGDGMKKPRGLLSYGFVAPGSWANGSFRYLATGVSGGFAVAKPDNTLIDVVYAVKSLYRKNASWLMNRSTIGEVRKLKDGEDRPLWQPSTIAGQPDMLLGHAVDEDEYMPAIGADTMAMGFGDWKRTYLIIDRLGVRLLRDPYTTKGTLFVYTTKLVGGGVQNFDAACFLKFGTS